MPTLDQWRQIMYDRKWGDHDRRERARVDAVWRDREYADKVIKEALPTAEAKRVAAAKEQERGEPVTTVELPGGKSAVVWGKDVDLVRARYIETHTRQKLVAEHGREAVFRYEQMERAYVGEDPKRWAARQAEKERHERLAESERICREKEAAREAVAQRGYVFNADEHERASRRNRAPEMGEYGYVDRYEAAERAHDAMIRRGLKDDDRYPNG